MFYLLYSVALTSLILFYFRLANYYNIVDRPNHRSSHNYITIRGGGVIFPIAILAFEILNNFQYPFFSGGLMLISLVSFYDDLRPLLNRIRILVHLIAVSLMFIETGFINYPLWLIFLSYILIIGTINAINFMDGINGITVAYGLVTIFSLYFVNQNVVFFVSSDWLIISGLALLIFAFFNFRQVAKCFAGDVGSVSIAFIIIFFLLLLMLKTGELKYIGLLLVYGLDAVITILFRLLRKENIFEAHRSHFYQFLSHTKKWPHLVVASLYALIQGFINALIIRYSLDFKEFLIVIVLSGIIFVLIRFLVEGKKHLMGA